MKMKKIMCALLALLMVIVPLALAACQDSSDNGTTTTAAGDGTGDTQAAGDDTGDSAETETFDIAENDLYSGRTFTILCHTDLTYNYGTTDFDEPSDDAREQALYDRGIAVEELLGVTVDMYQDDLGADIYSLMKTDVDSGTTNYDIVFNNMPYSCTATGAGYCLNIDEISYIDLSKSWWNADCTEQLALNGDHYMVSGDIAVSDKECIWVVYFLTDLIESHGLEDPYDLVENNEWTWDKMMQMADAADYDSNGNGTRDSGDIYGLCTHGENYPASWESAGLKLITLDSTGYPTVSWGTDEFVEVYTQIQELMDNDEVVSPSDISFISTALKQGQTLFGTEVIAFAMDYRENEYDFGILPYPKYSSDTDRYYSYVAVSSCVMTVEYTHNDTDFVGMVTEALAYYGQVYLTPAYYEVQLQSRFSRDERSADMLDIIFEYRCYDLGVFFDWGSAYSKLATSGASPATLYASLSKSISKSIEKSLEKLASLS